MADQLLTRIEIFDTKIKMEHHRDGTVKTQFSSPDAFAMALAKEIRLDTGILPQGIVRYVAHNDMTLLYYYFPEHRRPIKISGTTYNNVILPHHMFVIGVKQTNRVYRFVTSRLFALKGPVLKETDKIYRFPITNVDNIGRICWGGHTAPNSWLKLSGISGYAEQFFSSMFNDHLDDGNFIPFTTTVKNKEVQLDRVHALVKYLDTAKEFPYKILIDFGTIETFHKTITREMKL